MIMIGARMLIKVRSFLKARHRFDLDLQLHALGKVSIQTPCGLQPEAAVAHCSRSHGQLRPRTRIAHGKYAHSRPALVCALLRTGGARSRRVKYRHGTILIRGVILCHVQLQPPSRERFGTERLMITVSSFASLIFSFFISLWAEAAAATPAGVPR